tara:strand:+ start:1015 stop:1479 length:465 start_codon:yes stop_codon:yes gene_type:complete
MIIATIVFLLIFILFILARKEGKGLGYTLLYATALLVAPMSHLWHIIYGEGRIYQKNCGQENEVFGWGACFTGSWDQWTNSYELTLPIEFYFLGALVYYIQEKFSVFTLNSIHLILTTILLFSPPQWLNNGFDNAFNVIGLIFSICIYIANDLL